MALYNTTTEQEFDEKVLKSDKVVLVDFWAEWCPPCLAMAPTLHDVAGEMDAEVDIVKVNIEESRDNGMLANRFGIRSIPNMNVFKNGNIVDAIIGIVPKSVLEETLKKHV